MSDKLCCAARWIEPAGSDASESTRTRDEKPKEFCNCFCVTARTPAWFLLVQYSVMSLSSYMWFTEKWVALPAPPRRTYNASDTETVRHTHDTTQLTRHNRLSPMLHATLHHARISPHEHWTPRRMQADETETHCSVVCCSPQICSRQSRISASVSAA